MPHRERTGLGIFSKDVLLAGKIAAVKWFVLAGGTLSRWLRPVLHLRIVSGRAFFMRCAKEWAAHS